MSDDLKELKRLAEAASGQGWYASLDVGSALDVVTKDDADYVIAANPATILKLLEELEQAKADAERMDWIDGQRSNFYHGVVLGLHFVKGSLVQQFHGATFRAAIDAAIQSQEVNKC